MPLTYEKRNEGISVEWKKSVHVPPHMHEAIEIIYVTDGTVELGIGQELYHMEKGDFAIVFPNVVHHYQVFDSGKNKAVYLMLGLAVAVIAVNGFVSRIRDFNTEMEEYAGGYDIKVMDEIEFEEEEPVVYTPQTIQAETIEETKKRLGF